jgi:hypothetical protein
MSDFCEQIRHLDRMHEKQKAIVEHWFAGYVWIYL